MNRKKSAFVEVIGKMLWNAKHYYCSATIMWPKIVSAEIIAATEARSWRSIVSTKRDKGDTNTIRK